MRWLLFCAALCTGTGARAMPPGRPNDSVVSHDIRCLTAMSMARQGKATFDESGKTNGAALGVLYYLGRVDAKAPDNDLGKAMKDARAAIIADGNFPEIVRECGEALAKRTGKLAKSLDNAIEKPAHQE